MRVRPVRNAIVTILAGGLVGFTASAVIGYVAGSTTPGGDPGAREPADVHSFIQTYVVRVAKTPESITYLGGVVADGVGIHEYVVGIRDDTGDSVLAPVKVTFAGGRVIRLD